jgi:hypothetical protein
LFDHDGWRERHASQALSRGRKVDPVVHRAMSGLTVAPASARIAEHPNAGSWLLRVLVVLLDIFHAVSDYSCFVRFQQRY